jgi:hypothetical protein
MTRRLPTLAAIKWSFEVRRLPHEESAPLLPPPMQAPASRTVPILANLLSQLATPQRQTHKARWLYIVPDYINTAARLASLCS